MENKNNKINENNRPADEAAENMDSLNNEGNAPEVEDVAQRL